MRFLTAIRPGSIDVAIDIGAALGSYSWILNRVARTVYAFEPGNAHYSYLSRVIVGTKIHLVRAAVGSVRGHANLYIPGADSNALHSATLSTDNPITETPTAHVEQVEQVTLDGFLDERLDPARRVDFLKIDVEGYELEVLKGALGTLSQHFPVIICEIEARHNPSYGEVFELLGTLGYCCHIFRAGRCERLDNTRIEDVQLEQDLKVRMSEEHDPENNAYINNFLFQHPRSRIRINE